MQSSRGGKIMLYQDLYTRYSRLQFSHNSDRPIAIAGLEKRLIHSHNIRGGFGVLDDENHGLLRRSLSWRRADSQVGLEKIDFSGVIGLSATVPKPPTWSWMAYNGAIEYMDLPFDQVDWEKQDIVSPWSTSPLETWSYSGDSSNFPLGLKVLARQFDGGKAADILEDATIVLDVPQVDNLALECVILGSLKSPDHRSRDERIHFVLLVTIEEPQGHHRGLRIYNRAGVGSMPGRLICFNGEGSWGEIQ